MSLDIPKIDEDELEKVTDAMRAAGGEMLEQVELAPRFFSSDEAQRKCDEWAANRADRKNIDLLKAYAAQEISDVTAIYLAMERAKNETDSMHRRDPQA